MTARIHAAHLCEWAGRNHGPSSIPMLIQTLEDPSAPVREGALLGLRAAVTDTITMMALCGGIHEPSPGVRETARDVLEDFAGILKHLADDPGDAECDHSGIGLPDCETCDMSTDRNQDRRRRGESPVCVDCGGEGQPVGDSPYRHCDVCDMTFGWMVPGPNTLAARQSPPEPLAHIRTVGDPAIIGPGGRKAPAGDSACVTGNATAVGRARWSLPLAAGVHIHVARAAGRAEILDLLDTYAAGMEGAADADPRSIKRLREHLKDLRLGQ